MKRNVRKFGVPAVMKISAVALVALCLQPMDTEAANVKARTGTADTASAQAAPRTVRNRMTADTAAIIEPFQNSADSVSIDELTVENGEDRIALYGALNITRDKEGLRRAQALKALLDETVRRLSSEQLPDHVAIKPAAMTGNPFQ